EYRARERGAEDLREHALSPSRFLLCLPAAEARVSRAMVRLRNAYRLCGLLTTRRQEPPAERVVDEAGELADERRAFRQRWIVVVGSADDDQPLWVTRRRVQLAGELDRDDAVAIARDDQDRCADFDQGIDGPVAIHEQRIDDR